HAGHYKIVQNLIESKLPNGEQMYDSIIIINSSKARLAQSDSVTKYITPDMSMFFWETFLTDTDSERVEVRTAEHNTPIKDVYDIILNETSYGDTLTLISSAKDQESDRFDAFQKFSTENELGVIIKCKYVNIFS